MSAPVLRIRMDADRFGGSQATELLRRLAGLHSQMIVGPDRRVWLEVIDLDAVQVNAYAGLARAFGARAYQVQMLNTAPLVGATQSETPGREPQGL